jgi:amino acid adenylation domain-containing protein
MNDNCRTELPHISTPAEGRLTYVFRQKDGEFDAFRLSFGQERLWLLDQLMPGSSTYNIPAGFRLMGRLDVAALESSFSHIMRRHEVLRTRFVAVDGQPLQVVAPPTPWTLAKIDLQELGESGREQEVHRLARAEAERPFDLSRGPLVRTVLIKLRPDEHLLLLTIHHIVSDGWSMGVLFNELAACYNAFTTAAKPSLPDLPIQYADYAVWQRRQLQGELLEHHLAYWREQLRDAPVPLLPTDRPDDGQSLPRLANRSMRVRADLLAKLRDLSRRESATLFMTLLAAFNTLLFRYTGQDDIVVSTSVAERNRPETEGLIGLLINLLLLRTRLSGNPRFTDLLARVRDVALNSYMHQELPFEKVVQDLRLGRTGRHIAHARVGFTLQSRTGEMPHFSGLVVESFKVDRSTAAKLDLTLFGVELPNELALSFEYDANLFEPAVIESMCENLEGLLGHVADQPGDRIRMIPLFRREVARSLRLPAALIGRAAPLSPTQLDLYLAHVRDPHAVTYSLGLSVRLGQDLDPCLWEEAVRCVIAHEDTLRTRFYCWRGEPYQLVDYNISGNVAHVGVQRGQSCQDIIDSFVRVPYDLFQGPLFQNVLVSDVDGSFIALFAYHHILCDGQSVRNYFERVSRTYEDLRRGHQGFPPENSFYDFVADALSSFDRPETIQYWINATKTVIPLESRGANGVHRTAASRVTIEGRELEQIRVFCKSSGVSLHSYMLGIYGCVIANYFDPAADFVVYNIIGSRPREHTQTIGCFYHVVPVVFPRKLHTDGLLARHYIDHARSYRRNLGPMENISVLAQKRVIREEQLRFVYNAYNFSAVRLMGSERFLRVHESFPDDEVNFIVDDRGDRLELNLHYSPRRLADEHFLDRIVSASRRLLEGDLPARFDLLLERERSLLTEWNNTGTDHPESLPHELFEAQARRVPDAIAVAEPSRVLTYAELNFAANRVARSLVFLGVQPEMITAICVPRSIEFLVAVLATFKAGAAYVPVDPEWPPNRIREILRTSRVRALLVTEGSREIMARCLKDVPDCDPILVSIDEAVASSVPEASLPISSCARNLAYVIYTSGSTGIPKGAMLEQAGLRNHLHGKIQTLGLTSSDVVAQTASPTVDVSVWQLLAVLLVGGQIYIPDTESVFDPLRLLKSASAAGVTVLEIVPSQLRLMVDAGADPSFDLSRLRWLIVNGEALPPDLCRRWFQKYPDTCLINAYGPTECSDDVTQFRICTAPPPGQTRVPIGYALPNLRLYLLDAYFRQVPIGHAGELWVGGVGVGRGYLHDPARTAEAFLPDPFSSIQGARLYRTGDVGSRLEDGALVFLERMDGQVKIRGFRVELGEIEAALRRHPTVEDAAVVARKTESEDNRLTAYVVSASVDPSPHELYSWLRQSLPQYMVPAAIVMIQALPLTASGKIDRRALADMQGLSASSDDHYLAPRTPAEADVAAIWREVLGVERLGIHDDFFELGGHSLMVIQIASRIRDTFHVEVPVRSLFERPTIAEFVPVVVELQQDADRHLADVSQMFDPQAPNR